MDRFVDDNDFKLTQASEEFVEMESKSSSFFVTNFNFFCFNISLVFIVFFVLRRCFYWLFEYKISVLFRKYAFKLVFVCLLMEGNLESFSYLFIFDITHLNSKNYWQKGVNILTVALFTIFFLYLISWFFVIKIIQKNKASHFFDNFQTNIKGIVFRTIECGILNFCLGACHILLESHYWIQILALTCLEVGYILLLVFSIKSRKVYHFKYVGWQNIAASFLRILLIFTLKLDKDMLQLK